MVQTDIYAAAQRAADTILDTNHRGRTIPITFVSAPATRKELTDLTASQRSWLKTSSFNASSGEFVLLPDENGKLARVICGMEETQASHVQGERASVSSTFCVGSLSARLPAGDYHFDRPFDGDDMAAQAWSLGTYTYDPYKSDADVKACRLKAPDSIDASTLRNIANGVFLGRDLINTPANHLGPDELEAASRALAKHHDAKITVITGDDLIKKNFPMIHAVGRASDRSPRLIDIQWGKKADPTVTLVGKGIVFDTGGLNLKPGNSMTLMKKDMGGAATALSIASMVMSEKLPVRLRVLLPVAENSVSANAYRPGDVLTSRNGMTVEIGNTDAEGRLVLADALSLADEDVPDALFCFATLTGAARVALGPDLPPLYTTTDQLADDVLEAADRVNDPMWRMPFWSPYNQMLHSSVADVSHIANAPFAGSVTAALFLKRFVVNTDNFAHIDMYGWVPTAKSGFPKGGEPHTARAVFDWARRSFGNVN